MIILFFNELFLNSNIISLDKANNFSIVFRAVDIKDEYIIFGNWYSKSKEPLLLYIWWIVLSLKNNVFIVK